MLSPAIDPKYFEPLPLQLIGHLVQRLLNGFGGEDRMIHRRHHGVHPDHGRMPADEVNVRGVVLVGGAEDVGKLHRCTLPVAWRRRP